MQLMFLSHIYLIYYNNVILFFNYFSLIIFCVQGGDNRLKDAKVNSKENVGNEPKSINENEDNEDSLERYYKGSDDDHHNDDGDNDEDCDEDDDDDDDD